MGKAQITNLRQRWGSIVAKPKVDYSKKTTESNQWFFAKALS